MIVPDPACAVGPAWPGRWSVGLACSALVAVQPATAKAVPAPAAAPARLPCNRRRGRHGTACCATRRRSAAGCRSSPLGRYRRRHAPQFQQRCGPGRGRKRLRAWRTLARAAWRGGNRRFGAHMQVHLVNDGPVTFWLRALAGRAAATAAGRPGHLRRRRVAALACADLSGFVAALAFVCRTGAWTALTGFLYPKSLRPAPHPFPAQSPMAIENPPQEPPVRPQAAHHQGSRTGLPDHAEVNDHLPDDIVDPEQIEDIIGMINGMGIEVHEVAPDTEPVDARGALHRGRRRDGHRGSRGPCCRRSMPRWAALLIRCACTCKRWARWSCSRARARAIAKRIEDGSAIRCSRWRSSPGRDPAADRGVRPAPGGQEAPVRRAGRFAD